MADQAMTEKVLGPLIVGSHDIGTNESLDKGSNKGASMSSKFTLTKDDEGPQPVTESVLPSTPILGDESMDLQQEPDDDKPPTPNSSNHPRTTLSINSLPVLTPTSNTTFSQVQDSSNQKSKFSISHSSNSNVKSHIGIQDSASTINNWSSVVKGTGVRTKNIFSQPPTPPNQDITISSAFITANLVPGVKSIMDVSFQEKSNAQTAAPQVVTASVPKKGTTPDCGILVERLKGSTFDEYARAIEAISGKKSLVFIGQNPENSQYVLAFVERPSLVDNLVSLGINIRSKWMCVTRISQPASKLIISDVMPFIPDQVIINACKEFGKPVYDTLRRIPSSTRSSEFKHLLSYRRELLIVLDESKPLPENICIFSNNRFYKLGITPPGLVCYNCRIPGHRAFSCKAPRQEHITSLRDEDDDNGSTSIHGNRHTLDTRSMASTSKDNLSHTSPLSLPSRKTNDTKSSELPTQESFGIFTPLQDIPLVDESHAEGFPQAFSNKLPIKKNDWKVAGKKGKPKTPSQELPKKSHIPNSYKIGRFSNGLSPSEHPPSRADTQSCDGSTDDEPKSDATTSPVKLGKRGKEKKPPNTVDTPPVIIKESPQRKLTQPIKTSTMQDKPPFVPNSVNQLRHLISQIKENQPKHQQKEIEAAEPIVENLLESVSFLRTAKRRAALTALQEKHSHLIRYVDTILTLVPSDQQGSQVYKSLSSIKQDIKSLAIFESRKSHMSKSQ